MSITKPGGALAKSFRSLSNSTLYRRSKHFYQQVMKTSKFGRWLLKISANIKNWFKRHLMAINIFDNLGLAYIGPVDGHNIKDMEKAFSKAKKIDRSVVVHLKTLKGKGFAPSENDDSGKWHVSVDSIKKRVLFIILKMVSVGLLFILMPYFPL